MENHFRIFHPKKIELCFYCLFIWTPRQKLLLNLKYSLWCSIRRKLDHNRSRKEKQRAIIRLSPLRFRPSPGQIFSTPLRFRNKAQEDKELWKEFALMTVSCVSESESFKQIIHQHKLSNQGRKVLPTCSQNCAAMKRPSWNPF